MSGIGTLREDSLHAALKAWYAEPGDLIECEVDGYVIDLVRGDLLIEIQTGNFSALKQKLARLLEAHSIRVLYPVAVEKWVVRISPDGEMLGRRKSPKHGRVGDVFHELVHVAALVKHPHLSLEVLLTREEAVWREDGLGSWRRKGRSKADRRLLEVVLSSSFEGPEDFLALLPAGLPEVFTVPDLSEFTGEPPRRSQKTAYCLREMGVTEVMGKRGRAPEYRVAPEYRQTP